MHTVVAPCHCCAAADEPLRHFLDDLRGLYPAFPTLLHTLLAALSATADSGGAYIVLFAAFCKHLSSWLACACTVQWQKHTGSSTAHELLHQRPPACKLNCSLPLGPLPPCSRLG